MKKTCNQYTSEDVSRFMDNELSSDQHQALAEHLGHCPDCRRLAEQFQTISDVFTGFTDKETARIDPGRPGQKLERYLQKYEKRNLGTVFGLFGKNIYLKLASIAAILLISLFAFQAGRFTTPAGPSAIVKSLDTDVASVMIIETEKEKHTIIWFSET